MEKLRAQLITAEEESTPTVMAFSEVANDYLDFAKRRFVPKTYEKKVYVFNASVHLWRVTEPESRNL